MRRPRGCVAVALAVVGLAGCGKKGPPQPPLRPVPRAVTSVTADRLGGEVTLRFTLPTANTDGTTPVALDRVDVYAMTTDAAAPAPTAAALLDTGRVVGSLAVGTAGMASTEPGVQPPVPGGLASVVDQLAADTLGPDTVRYYVVVGRAGRRHGPPSAPVAVPLAAGPGAPSDVRVEYDEKTFTVSWAAGRSNDRYLVYAAGSTSAEGALLLPEPLAEPRFSGATDLGQERCFVVRAVHVSGSAWVRGDATAPSCVMFVDRFPPPAPGGLLAVAGESGIDLTWSAVEAADFAGYGVLRGDGPDGTLRRLTADPIAATQYRDSSVQAGVTYVYAVVALDKAVPPNQSAPSNRQVVTAR